MDISVEVIYFSELAYRFAKQLHSFVGTVEHRGREEQSLDIVAFIKINDYLAYFVGSGSCPSYVGAPPVGAVFAVVYAVVAHKYFK